MYELTHAVQWRNTGAKCDVGWHTIAAFDSEPIAAQYMRECIEFNGFVRDWEYRVIPIDMHP